MFLEIVSHGLSRAHFLRSTLADANERRDARLGVNLHTLLALQGNIPTVVIFTSARVADVNMLDELDYEAGAFYIFDRGYLDFARPYRVHQCWRSSSRAPERSFQ